MIKLFRRFFPKKQHSEDIFQLFHGIITNDFIIAEELCRTEIICLKYQTKNAKINAKSHAKVVKEIESDKKKISKRKTFSVLTSYRKSFESVALISKKSWKSDIQTLDKHLQFYNDINKTFKKGIRDQTKTTFQQYNADKMALQTKRNLFNKQEAAYLKKHAEYQKAVVKFRQLMADTTATDATKNKNEFTVNKLIENLDILEKNYVDSAEVFNDKSDEFYSQKMPNYLNALRCLHTRYSEILNDFIKECKNFQNELTTTKQETADRLTEIKESYLSGKEDSSVITQLVNQEEFKTLTTKTVKLHPDIELESGTKKEIPIPADIPKLERKISKIQLKAIKNDDQNVPSIK